MAILNFFLWLLLIVPGIIHALFVVYGYEEDQRNKKLIRAVKHSQ